MRRRLKALRLLLRLLRDVVMLFRVFRKSSSAIVDDTDYRQQVFRYEYRKIQRLRIQVLRTWLGRPGT